MYSIFDEFTEEQITEAGNHYPALRRYSSKLKEYSGEENFKLRRLHEWCRVSIHSHFNSESQKRLLIRWSTFVEKEVREYFDALNLNDLHIYALGKLGALELNLSSDIDIVVVGDLSYENEKALKKFIDEFSARDQFGFFTRVDIDIRPGGSHSPLIQNLEQIENYYYYHGEAWERLALIRLSKIFSDDKTEKSMFKLRKKFCFRKHLDFNAFEEFSILRSKIHSAVKGKTRDTKVDIKLFPGCIRDIELFTHTLCVLHGGRSSELDLRGTEAALYRLGQLGIVDQKEVEFLIGFYWDLRRLENLIQSKEDAQTHSVELSSPLIPLVFDNLEAFNTKRDNCHRIVSNFIHIQDSKLPQLPDDRDEQHQLLQELGFTKEIIHKNWDAIITNTARSRFSEKDEDIRKEVIYSFLQEISKNSENKNLAFEVLGDFFKAVRAKASLFKFFQVHPEVISDLSYLFGLSPFLSSKICNRPEIVDNFVYRAQATPPEDLDHLLEFLADHKQLGHILYSLDFVKNSDIHSFTKNISELANFITRALLAKCCDDTKLDILKMGKWGGNELGLHSDLDFVFVYRSPHIPQEVHKMIRRFLTYIQANYRAGHLYGIDLRLRPSGSSGPLLVTQSRLHSYLKEKAKIWERQAYLKASYLNSDSDDIFDLITEKEITIEDKKELKEIREQLLKEHKPKDNCIDIKYSPGGLVEIELCAQQKVLELQKNPKSHSNLGILEMLSEIDAHWLNVLHTYQDLRKLEQGLPIFRQRSDAKIMKDTSSESKRAFKFTDNLTDYIDLEILLKENHHRLQRLVNT